MVIEFNAEHFVRAVREKQQESTRQMRGRPGLSQDVRGAIKLATEEVCSFTAIQHDPQIAEDLLLRFEEMCRRNELPVPSSGRQAVLSYLMAELDANLKAIPTKTGELIPVTAYAGAVLPFLPQEFPEFSETPGIFRQIAVNNPTDPRAALRRVQTTIAEMTAEAEFTEFSETPGIFLRIAVNNPTDPRAALRRVQTTIAEMTAEAEFAEFSETPGIFLRIAVGNPTDPRTALRRVQTTITEMTAEAEFAEFSETPWIFRQIAVGNPTDPRAALRRVQTTITEMTAEAEFAEFSETPWIFRQIAVSNPMDPRAALRKILMAKDTKYTP